VIPEALRPYMFGMDFLPYTRELPKDSTSARAKKGA
jgi:seryl-tRNA synthetase